MKGEKEPGIIIPHLWGAIKLSPTSARGVQLKPRDYLRALLIGTACSKAWQSSRSPLCQWENRPLQVWCSRLSPLSLTPNTSSCFPCSSLWVLPSSGIPLFLLGVLGYMLTCPNLRQSTFPYLRFHLCYPGDNRTCAMIKQLKFMSSLQNSYQQQISVNTTFVSIIIGTNVLVILQRLGCHICEIAPSLLAALPLSSPPTILFPSYAVIFLLPLQIKLHDSLTRSWPLRQCQLGSWLPAGTGQCRSSVGDWSEQKED